MFTGRSLADLANELKRQAESKRDFKAPTSLMEMVVSQPKHADLLEDKPEVLFRVGDKFEGPPTELMHDQLGTYLGIHSKYYDKMREEAPALLTQNVNVWLKRNRETRLVRTLDGKARAMLSNRYRTIDNFDIANAALPVLISESEKLGSVETVSSDVTDRRLYLKVISNRLTYEVKKGDVVQAGIVISNSEVGMGSVRVEPFLFRLACLNGAIISDEAVRRFHIGKYSSELIAAEEVFQDETRRVSDQAFMLQLQDVVRASFDDANFEKLKGITIDSTTRKITSPVQDVVEEISNRFKLTERHRESFLQNLIEGHDTTQWGFANAITAIANKADNYEQATDLERIGGELIALDGKGWKELAAA